MDAPSATRLRSVVERDAPHEPLTPGEKFTVAFRRTANGSILFRAGAEAGLAQATDQPRGYGQGGDGYARRYGAAIANNLSYDFFGRFAFPVLFRQDPRYFRAGSAPTGARIKYAVSRVLVTRTDSGGRAFNSSQVLGSLFSSALTNAYYPQQDRDAANTFSRAGLRLLASAGGNLVREFWPDLRRKLKRKNKTVPIDQANPARTNP